MRKMSTTLIGLTTALTLTVVACGDSLTGVTSGDELSSTEVAAVLAALGSAFETVGAQAAPSQAAISVNTDFDVTVECESGTLKVSGSVAGTFDDETFESDLSTTVRWEPNACVVSDESTGKTFTVDGAPRVELVLDITTTLESVTVSGTQEGGFSYTSSDGRTGSCAMDVTFSIVTTESSVDATVTGTICGLAASGFDTLG